MCGNLDKLPDVILKIHPFVNYIPAIVVKYVDQFFHDEFE